MPNVLDANGLETASQAELLANLTTALETIYAVDINVDPDSADGEWIMEIVQTAVDVEDLLTSIYTMFDPDQAVGVILDQRCAINGVQRQGGTFTVTNATLTTSGSFTLQGLDLFPDAPYTVSDSAGNQWQLQFTVVNPTSGAYAFQAATPGAVLTIPNTITLPVTIVLGVTAINNPTAYTSLGVNEESDAQFKIRRSQSTAQGAQGYFNSLLAALQNISGVGVGNAFLYENDTGATFTNTPGPGNIHGLLAGLPGHSIWAIVGGSGSSADIAQAIYNGRNAGCGMFGAISYGITQADGSTFLIFWDTVAPENLFIHFVVASINGVNAPNINAIRSGLVTNFIPGVAQQVNVNALATAIQQIDPNTVATGLGFSTTSGGSYTPTLLPTSAKNQFVLQQSNIIITPIILASPTSVISVNSSNVVIVTDLAVHSGPTITFTPQGGFGTMSFVLTTNNSGGSVNSSTGVYTPGSTPNVSDVLTVTDSLSNTAQVTITVS